MIVSYMQKQEIKNLTYGNLKAYFLVYDGVYIGLGIHKYLKLFDQ